VFADRDDQGKPPGVESVDADKSIPFLSTCVDDANIPAKERNIVRMTTVC
jgi:hypothetical protein